LRSLVPLAGFLKTELHGLTLSRNVEKSLSRAVGSCLIVMLARFRTPQVSLHARAQDAGVYDLASTPTTFVALTSWYRSSPSSDSSFEGFISTDGQAWANTFNAYTFSNLRTVGNRVVGFWAGALRDPVAGVWVPPPPEGFAFSGAASDDAVISVGQGSISHGRELGGSWTLCWRSPEITISSSAAAGPTFVAVGFTNSAGGLAVPQILLATNGLPSTSVITPPEGAAALNCIRHADGKFVAVGRAGTIIRSTDGVNWTRRLSNTTSDLNDVARGNFLWVAVGANGKIVTSSDASFFSLRSSNTEVPIFGIAFGAGQFVAVGKDGLVLNSSNGIDWSTTGTDEARDLYSIAYGVNRFVAVGTNGIVHVSTNATQWQSTTVPNVTAFSRVAFAHGYFVALASTNNAIFASTNGLTWTSSQINDSVNLLGLDFSDGELWLTGEKSTIYKTSLISALAPILTASQTANKQLVLTLRPANPGNYEIQSGSSLPSSAWSPLTTLTNVGNLSTWIDTNPPQPVKFYRAVRQELGN
jgi:hypothetical protein